MVLLGILLLRVVLRTACHGGRRRCLSAHLLVVRLVLSQDLLAEFLLALVDIRVKLVTVLSNGKLLIVVNGNENLLLAVWLFIGVVELGYIGVLQSLCSRHSLVGIKLKEVPDHVKGIVRCSGEHVAQLLWLGGREALEHCLGERAVN